MSSPIVTFRNAARNASCPIMSWVSGNSVVRSSPLYCILMAKLGAPASVALFPHSCHGAASWAWHDLGACTAGPGHACFSGRSMVSCGNALSRPLEPGVETRLCGSPRRSEKVPLFKVGRRRLMPNLEQVTCSEPTVAPISSAISSRLLPRSTRFLICCIRSGVNFICRPELGPGMPSSAVWVISVPSVHFFVAGTLVRDLLRCAKHLLWHWPTGRR